MSTNPCISPQWLFELKHDASVMNLLHTHSGYQKDPASLFKYESYFLLSQRNAYLHYFIYSINN